MHATIRRYEAIDETRISEIVKKVDDSLLPRLNELPGFSGYYLIEAGNGVISSVGFFDTAEHAEKSKLGASREAGDGCAESAKDHQRTGSRTHNASS